MAKQIWAIKYRPTTIDGYIFNTKNLQKKVKEWITAGTIPHLFLEGRPGTGKTTLAKVLVNEINVDDMDFLTINGSDENSVDVVRHKIKTFVSTMSVGDFKVVLIDEADHLSQGAQHCLCNMMETYADNARFIFTCNKAYKVDPAIISRCQTYKFNKLEKEDMLEQAVKILAKEKVKIKKLELLEEYVDMAYPDFRRVLNALEQNTINGRLKEPEDVLDTDVKGIKLIEFMENGTVFRNHSYIFENVGDDDIPVIYDLIKDNLSDLSNIKSNKIKLDAAIAIFAEAVVDDSVSLIRQVTLANCLTKLSNL